MKGLLLLLFGLHEPRDINMKAIPPYVECWNGGRWSYPPLALKGQDKTPFEFGRMICEEGQ